MIADTLLAYLDRLTPIQCYLIARRLDSRGRRISLREIAGSTGMSIQQVTWIAYRKTWKGIAPERIDSFMAACGITMRNRARHLIYIRRTATKGWPLAHLSTLPMAARKSLLNAL